MRREACSRMSSYVRVAGIVLIVAALATPMTGCVFFRYRPIPDPGPSLDLEIRTWHDLDAVRDNLRGHHRLMNDLDATTAGYEELAGPAANQGQGWEPIGSGHLVAGLLGIRLAGEVFTGSFDGQSHEIRDLFINRGGWGGSGLFGCVGTRGIIGSLGVTNATVTIPEVGTLGVAPIAAVGILAGFSMGSVSHSYASGAISGDMIVGGLVGQNAGTVSDSYSTANVTGQRCIGGLVGMNGSQRFSGTVSKCFSTGNVTGYEYVGGLVGKNEGTVPGADFRGTVTNCFWDIETSRQAASDGGTGKTTVVMMDIGTFTDTDTEGLDEPWDMVAVSPGESDEDYTWNIVDGQTYPFLSWQSV